jgi:hypothetical protein
LTLSSRRAARWSLQTLRSSSGSTRRREFSPTRCAGGGARAGLGPRGRAASSRKTSLGARGRSPRALARRDAHGPRAAGFRRGSSQLRERC